MKHTFTGRNSFIEAGNIRLGKDAYVGENVQIKVRGEFSLGECSKIGNNTKIVGENVSIGSHFFCTGGLNIDGGGSQFYKAVLKIGDRCVMHNNYINICEPVVIGNDVGLSPDVQIITHGFWSSVLEGYPVKYQGVVIGDNVIIGQRSMVLMGVKIAKNCVVGAQSVVCKSLEDEKAVYAGNPAKWIRKMHEPTQIQKIEIMAHLLDDYKEFITHYYPVPDVDMEDFPVVRVNDFSCDVFTGKFFGTETFITDDFRDFLRRHGIRIYTSRPFGVIV